jgi:putative hydrolase of HD superfamily
LFKVRELYKLKEVYRRARVEERRESSAEHTWSCMILADYLMDHIKNLKVDRLKVHELLLYHDVVEIESGDVSIAEIKDPEEKRKKEYLAVKKLKKTLPKDLGAKLEKMFEEFDEEKTLEAKFATAVDKLDALMQHMNHKPDWKGWDEKRVWKYHGEAFNFSPEMKQLFSDVLEEIRNQGYFDQ